MWDAAAYTANKSDLLFMCCSVLQQRQELLKSENRTDCTFNVRKKVDKPDAVSRNTGVVFVLLCAPDWLLLTGLTF